MTKESDGTPGTELPTSLKARTRNLETVLSRGMLISPKHYGEELTICKLVRYPYTNIYSMKELSTFKSTWL